MRKQHLEYLNGKLKKMQPIFRKELTKRAQLIYYHFTTIGAETGSFRSIRTVFSERIFFGENTKNFVCEFTTILQIFTTI